MKPMLNPKPPWYAYFLKREKQKMIAMWLAIVAFLVLLAWPDSREKKVVREVNERAAYLLENFDKLPREEVISELEEIRALTYEPEPEPEDPY